MSDHALTEPLPRDALSPAARGWRRWVVPKPFDGVTSLLYLGVLVLFFYERMQGSWGHAFQWWQAGVSTAAVLALIVLDRAEFWRYGEAPPLRMAVGLLAVRIILIEIVAQLDDFSFSPFLYLIVPFTAALYFGSKVSYWVAAGVWVVYVLKFTSYQASWYTTQQGVYYALLFTVGLIFAIGMAKVMRNEKLSRARAESLLAELASSHRRLQAYAEQVEELATAKERNRLARDIHDSLGHYLTVINVQLEKALAFRDQQPAAADQAVRDAKRLAREALQDVRGSVGTLRAASDPLALTAALPHLVEPLRGGPLAVDLQIEGAEPAMAEGVRMALYRAVQEGLTNVQKHAGATTAEVILHFVAGGATLTVRDNGCGFSAADRTTRGYGLQGLQERLELVGGHLRIESRPGVGTCLHIEVPHDGVPPALDAGPAGGMVHGR